MSTKTLMEKIETRTPHSVSLVDNVLLTDSTFAAFFTIDRPRTIHETFTPLQRDAPNVFLE
ncbi:MAG: hypothetical protein ACYCXP_07195 [Leptospirillum sp.]